jgi:hypothetical protein
MSDINIPGSYARTICLSDYNHVWMMKTKPTWSRKAGKQLLLMGIWWGVKMLEENVRCLRDY